MSELKVNKVTPRSGTTVTLGDSGDSVAIPSGVGFNGFGYRNIIINGDMSIAQRGTSTASITSDGYYTCDRWNVGLGSFGTWTQSQSTDVPSGYGFAKSIKMDCTTAQSSPASGSLIVLEQKFEGQMLQYLKWGTASANQVTLSFWHKHTKTGTNIIELIDADNSDAVSGSYTQSVSNTWEKATITFPAKTSGALDNDNAVSLRLRFIMGAGTDYTSGTLATTWVDTIVNADRYVGQVNNADSTSNDFIITGVQLEAGTTASDFEFLPYDVNLARCQRYYQFYVSGASKVLGSGNYYDATTWSMAIKFSQTMRAAPSLVQVTGTNYYTIDKGSGLDSFDSFLSLYGSPESIAIYNASQVSGTAGTSFLTLSNQSGAFIAFSAEL